MKNFSEAVADFNHQWEMFAADMTRILDLDPGPNYIANLGVLMGLEWLANLCQAPTDEEVSSRVQNVDELKTECLNKVLIDTTGKARSRAKKDIEGAFRWLARQERSSVDAIGTFAMHCMRKEYTRTVCQMLVRVFRHGHAHGFTPKQVTTTAGILYTGQVAWVGVLEESPQKPLTTMQNLEVNDKPRLEQWRCLVGHLKPVPEQKAIRVCPHFLFLDLLAGKSTFSRCLQDDGADELRVRFLDGYRRWRKPIEASAGDELNKVPFRDA